MDLVRFGVMDAIIPNHHTLLGMIFDRQNIIAHAYSVRDAEVLWRLPQLHRLGPPCTHQEVRIKSLNVDTATSARTRVYV